MSTESLIIGGGITGCVSALILASQGHSVTLCEASSQLGGILKDQLVDGDTFFSCCQYLSFSESWFRILPSAVTDSLHCFEHRYGSVSEFEGSRVVSHDVAVPVFVRPTHDISGFSMELDNRTLASRFSFYPDALSDSLTTWASRYGIDPGAVCGENAKALQMARIYLADEDVAVAQLKQNVDFDSVLALPFRLRSPDKRVSAALPATGFDGFFAHLERCLEDLGVHILKNSPVKLKQTGTEVSFFARRREFPAVSRLVWAANPNPLLCGLGLPPLNNVYANSVTHFYRTACAAVFVDPFYIQVFSDQSDINRLYLYGMGSDVRLTVECFSGSDSVEDITREAQRILADFGFDLKIKWSSSRKERRYIFFTDSDRATMGDLLCATRIRDCTVVDAGWLDFGRDAKINRIVSQLQGSSFGSP